MEKITVISTALATAISIAAFVYGAVKLFKKEIPLYCQIIMWAVGCYCLQCIENCVVYICGDFSDRGVVAQLAMCGFYFALISANFGTLDNIVDDRSKPNGKYRKLALIAPTFYTIISVAAFVHIFPIYNFAAIVYGLSMLAIIVASYFNLKHLILPKDEQGILSCTKMCNIISLIFYTIAILLVLGYGRINIVLSNVSNVVLSVLVLLLTAATVKGGKSWPI